MNNGGESLILSQSQAQQAIARTDHHRAELVQIYGDPEEFTDPAEKVRLDAFIRSELEKLSSLDPAQINRSINAIFLGSGNAARIDEIVTVDKWPKNTEEKSAISLDQVLVAVKRDPEKAHHLVVALVDQVKNYASIMNTSTFVLKRGFTDSEYKKLQETVTNLAQDGHFLTGMISLLNGEPSVAQETRTYAAKAAQEINQAVTKAKEKLSSLDWAAPILVQLDAIEV